MVEECEHEWEYVDDSFSHEYGVERIVYWRCAICDATADANPNGEDEPYDLPDDEYWDGMEYEDSYVDRSA